jgi:hypothetical protein
MNIPILVVAFDRPKITKKLLAALGNLPDTHVFISIDRAKTDSPNFQLNSEVISACKDFAESSSHIVHINLQESNVGCNANTIQGMNSLLDKFESGVLLEDDCEFHPNYIKFLNENFQNIDYLRFMSLTPMNLDWDRDLVYLKRPNVYFNSSTLMGGSLGMTFSRESMSAFNNVLRLIKSKDLKTGIDLAVKFSGLNFMQRLILRELYYFKMTKVHQTWEQNATNRSNQTGWDTVWQFGAFLSRKKFLLPSSTLARESLSQEESQWHPHSFSYPSWVGIEFSFTIDRIDFKQEFKLHPLSKLDKYGLPKWPVREFGKLSLRKVLDFLRGRKLHEYYF